MITYLAAYQSFSNVKEMDLHIQKHITRHYENLNETDRTLLTVLSQYACKFPGAAHLKVETMCKAIKKSEATVRRSMRKLQELRIIKKIHTIRKVLKGYGANIIVILPYDDMSKVNAREDNEKPVTASNEEDFPEKETFISLSSKKELLYNTYIPEETVQSSPVDKSNEKKISTIYQQFKSTIFSMFGQDQQMVSRLYGVYRSLTYRVTSNFPQYRNFYENIGYQALLVSLQATKQKKVRNLSGYYVGVFEKMCQKDLFTFFEENEG